MQAAVIGETSNYGASYLIASPDAIELPEAAAISWRSLRYSPGRGCRAREALSNSLWPSRCLACNQRQPQSPAMVC